MKRLWQFLVRQSPVQTVFVKYIFSRRKMPAGASGLPPSGGMHESQSFVSRLSAEAANAVDGEPGEHHNQVCETNTVLRTEM